MSKKVMLSSLKADLAREKNGDWVPYPIWKGVAFNVSALTNPEYETARDLMFKRLAEIHGDERIPREVLSVELGKLYCEHILHGWRGLDIEYSPETALNTLGDPEYRAVVSAVEFCAAKLTDIEPKFAKAEEGNS